MSSVLPLRLIGSGFDKPPVIPARPDWSVQKLYDEVGRIKKAETDTFTLTFAGVPLNLAADNAKLVGEYGFHPNDSLVFCERTHGGATLQPLPGHVTLTKEECCYSFEDDENKWRAKLACGHVIAADALKLMCATALDAGNYKFTCPGCPHELNIRAIRHILASVMAMDDLTALADKVNDNFLKNPETDIRQCRVCGTNWKRDFTKNWPGHYNRIVCNTCTRVNGRETDYCWECREEWGNGSNRCGNPSCNWEKEQIMTLQKCDTIKIGKVSGCPIIRACPRCGTMIHHADACKHMRCRRCQCDFCFVCLNEKRNSHWPCGAYDAPCPVAPRQKSLPIPSAHRPTAGSSASSAAATVQSNYWWSSLISSLHFSYQWIRSWLP